MRASRHWSKLVFSAQSVRHVLPSSGVSITYFHFWDWCVQNLSDFQWLWRWVCNLCNNFKKVGWSFKRENRWVDKCVIDYVSDTKTEAWHVGLYKLPQVSGNWKKDGNVHVLRVCHHVCRVIRCRKDCSQYFALSLLHYAIQNKIIRRGKCSHLLQ